jgi:3-(3-hydroxy-phenyl)propionate hydroxylase
MKYKPKPRFLGGFFVPNGKGIRRTLAGRMFPQPIVMRPDGKLTLLDEALGAGFALVAFGQFPERALARWGQPVWEKLGVRRVGIYSLPCALPHQTVKAGILDAAVVDSERAIAAAWRGYEGQLLVLRPDRYVLGAFPEFEPEAAAEIVERLLAATWSAAPQAAPWTHSPAKATNPKTRPNLPEKPKTAFTAARGFCKRRKSWWKVQSAPKPNLEGDVLLLDPKPNP